MTGGADGLSRLTPGALLDALGQCCKAGRFGDEEVPGDHRSVRGCFLRGDDRGEKDHRHAFEFRVELELRGQVAGIDFRHHHVEKDEVGLKVASRLEGVAGVVFSAHRVGTGAFEVHFYRACDAGFVVDERMRLVFMVWFCLLVGIWIVTRTPPSVRLARWSVPPWS